MPPRLKKSFIFDMAIKIVGYVQFPIPVLTNPS